MNENPSYRCRAKSTLKIGHMCSQHTLELIAPNKHYKINTGLQKMMIFSAYLKSCSIFAQRKGRYGCASIPSSVNSKGGKFNDLVYLDYDSTEPTKDKVQVLTVCDGFNR